MPLLYYKPSMTLNLSPSGNLSDIHSTSIRITALMNTPLHTIDQVLASRLHPHTATSLVLLLGVLRHVFTAALL
jgi:hypothetical protein